jgi:hypothetical protein
MQRPKDGDLSREVTCPECKSVNVPLNDEPDIRFCLNPDCGYDITGVKK